MQWICHCVRLQIDSVGVFVWALAPFLCFGLFSAVCFAVSAGETQVWLGDLRVVVFGVVVFFVLLFFRFAYAKDFFVLVQCFVCLLTCKDRAISATSATLEGKKSNHNRLACTYTFLRRPAQRPRQQRRLCQLSPSLRPSASNLLWRAAWRPAST